VDNHDSDFLAVLTEDSPPLSHDMSGMVVCADYSRQIDMELLNLPNSVVVAELGEEPNDDATIVKKENNLGALGADAIII